MAWGTFISNFGYSSDYFANNVTVTASGDVGSSLPVGSGNVEIQLTISEYTGDANEQFVLFAEANTVEATTTWKQIGIFPVSAATLLGIATGNGSYHWLVKNPYNKDVKLTVYEVGSSMSMKVTAKGVPVI